MRAEKTSSLSLNGPIVPVVVLVLVLDRVAWLRERAGRRARGGSGSWSNARSKIVAPPTPVSTVRQTPVTNAAVQGGRQWLCLGLLVGLLVYWRYRHRRDHGFDPVFLAPPQHTGVRRGLLTARGWLE